MRIYKYANLQIPSPLCRHANVQTGKYANMQSFKCDMYIRICKYANIQIRKCRNMNIHHMEICKNTHTHKFASVYICKYFPICGYGSGCRFSFIWCVVAWLCIHICMLKYLHICICHICTFNICICSVLNIRTFTCLSHIYMFEYLLACTRTYLHRHILITSYICRFAHLR